MAFKRVDGRDKVVAVFDWMTACSSDNEILHAAIVLCDSTDFGRLKIKAGGEGKF